MTKSVAIAEGLKDALNAQTFSQAFVATREYVVISELQDLGQVRVTVVYKSVTAEPRFRSGDMEMHTLAIGVMQKPESRETADLDVLAQLVEEIYRWSKRIELTLSEDSNAVWLESGAEHLDGYLQELNQFAAVVTVKLQTVG